MSSSFAGGATIATTSTSTTTATSNMVTLYHHHHPHPHHPNSTTAATATTTTTTKLYNRSEDYAKLIDAYERRDIRHLVLLVGQPGNGKTTLAQTLQSKVESQDEKGFFISGRFDTLEYPEPFAPFISAATQYIQRIIQQEKVQQQSSSSSVSHVTRVKNALSRVMDKSELQTLATMIPAIGELFDLSPSTTTTTATNVAGAGSSSVTSVGSRTSQKSSSSSSSKKNTSSTSTTTTATSTTTTQKSSGRSSFLVSYCNLMRAISNPKYPIVLFLDDLQSSDSGSLEVLKVLIADKKIQGFLCMVAFRPVGVKHPFSLLLRTLESAGISFIPILPTPIDATSIYDMIQTTPDDGNTTQQQQQQNNNHTNLRTILQRNNTLESTCTAIASGTKGNPLAIQLCLKIMALNTDMVQQTGGTPPLHSGGDVKALFKVLFVTLSPTCQKVCWVASCMGMKVDTERLSKILTDDISEAIFEAESVGIMTYHRHPSIQEEEDSILISSTLKDCIITNERDLQHNGYCVFTNSTFKDCVYSMISSEDKKVQHAAIGNIYRLDVDQIGIYRVIAHMKLGVDLLSPKGKEALAQFCLQAGEHNSRWTEFVAASKYLDLGIKLLDDPKKLWKTQYQLAIGLYSASAEVYNCMGKYNEMDARLMEVLQNTKDSMDKLRAYTIQMQSLSSRTLHMDAISLGLKVLPKLGEPIPTRRTKTVIESELKSVKKLLESTRSNNNSSSSSSSSATAASSTPSETDLLLLNGPHMKDTKKLGAMTILNLLLASSFLGQGDLVPLVACRMVRVTLQSGLTGSSAVGFAVLGAALCNDGDIELGIWCSDMALKIVDVMEEKSCKGRVLAIHWGIVSRYEKSWKQCQEPLKIAYRLCMEGGDTEFALVSPVLSILNMLVASGSLSSVAEAMKSVYQLLYKKNQDIMMRMIRPFFQEVLNLMGATLETDPVVLSGSIMNEEEDLRFANDNLHMKVIFCIYLCQAELAFLMHKFQRAKDLIVQCIELGANEMIISSLSIKLLFLDAMTSVAMSWESGKDKKTAPREALKKKKKHLATVTGCLQKLEDLARYAPENLTHKVLMVQAELKSLEGDVDDAISLYKKSMDHAEQYGAMGDRALACERTGLVLRIHGKEDDALDYLEDCCGYYRQWGALVKVNHVKGNVIPQAIYEWDG